MVGRCLALICAVNYLLSTLTAQEYLLRFKNHQFEQIAIDEQKNIYLLNPKEATLSKFFKIQNYDSSLVIGGKNLSLRESFIKPSDILIPDSKTIFLVDNLANDIKFLNTNLKILKIWNLNQLKEEYQPFQIHSATITPTGEMFIQNKLNSLIYRINVFGEIDRTIGGNNFAEASITDNAQLVCTKEWLFVWVKNEKTIFQFDHNGNFKKSFKISNEIENIFSDVNYLMAHDKNQVFLFYKNEKITLFIQHHSPIIDAYLIDNHIYILDTNGICHYSLKTPNH